MIAITVTAGTVDMTMIVVTMLPRCYFDIVFIIDVITMSVRRCTCGGMYSGSDLSLKSPMLRSASRMACKSAADSKLSSGLVASKAISSASLLFLASLL